MKNQLESIKNEMYKIRRIQMYIVLIRMLFSLFIIAALALSIVEAITVNASYVMLKTVLITVAYVISVYAYHKTMTPMEKDYQAIKAKVEEIEKESENTI